MCQKEQPSILLDIPDADTALAQFKHTALAELAKLSEKLTPDYFQPAVALIRKAWSEQKRIHVTGIGKPQHIAAYYASLLSSLEIPCYLLDGCEATHGSSGQVAPGDVVICISYYGNVPELMHTMKTLQNNGARIISVTGFNDSWIAAHADVHLNCYVAEEGDYLNKPPRTSMLSALFVLMSLSVMLQSIKMLTPERYVRYHPSGQLGQL